MHCHVHFFACPQDYFFHNSGLNNGGNRYATIIAYLSDVEAGGETVSKSTPTQRCLRCNLLLYVSLLGSAFLALETSLWRRSVCSSSVQATVEQAVL
jgi:hypothetical protein